MVSVQKLGRRFAFSLLEILICIAILAILASLILSALSSAKDRAMQAGCSSNLKQIWQAVELYRNDWGGGVDRGTLAQMALPPDPSELTSAQSLWFACPRRAVAKNHLPDNYHWLAGTAGSMVEEKLWVPTTAKYGEATVLVSDWFHSDPAAIASRYAPKFGIGISVGGQLKHRRQAGEIHTVLWWNPRGDLLP